MEALASNKLVVLKKQAFAFPLSHDSIDFSSTRKARLIFLFSLPICHHVSLSDSGSVAEGCVTQRAAERHPGHTQRVFSWIDMMWPMAHYFFEHFSKACGHEVVKNRVDC